MGQDQLIGGTWPDNYAGVSCLDWNTGEPNAKYWVTRLLAATVGTTELKRFANATVSSPAAVYALPYSIDAPAAGGLTKRGILLVNKTPRTITATVAGVEIGLYPMVTLEKKATEYDRKSGVKWLSCTAK